MSRQGLYQRRQRQAGAARRAKQVLAQGRAVRARLPRLGTRKLRQKIAPLLRVQGMARAAMPCSPCCANTGS